MSQVHFTWNIESINTITGTMIVGYVREGADESSKILYEVNQPQQGLDIGQLIAAQSPQDFWKKQDQAAVTHFQGIAVGTTGTSRDFQFSQLTTALEIPDQPVDLSNP